MGAGNGGDDGAEEAAAEPVVLKMELHCAGCAQKVKKAIKRVPGTRSPKGDPFFAFHSRGLVRFGGF